MNCGGDGGEGAESALLGEKTPNHSTVSAVRQSSPISQLMFTATWPSNSCRLTGGQTQKQTGPSGCRQVG